LTGLLTRLLGDAPVVRISLLATAAGFGLMLLANSDVTLLLATGFLILAIALLGPVLKGVISMQTTLKQGVTMGVNNAFSSLGRIFGPLWAAFLFDVHMEIPFYSSAAILALAFVYSRTAGLSQAQGPRSAQHR
jgi:DHA1 family multidrug resistance protein-like MFS transporter